MAMIVRELPLTYVRELGRTCGMSERHVVGGALRALRINQQLRQMDLAKRAAVTPGHLCRIENNSDYCSDLLIVRLARILGCKVEDFTAPGKHPRQHLWRRAQDAA